MAVAFRLKSFATEGVGEVEQVVFPADESVRNGTRVRVFQGVVMRRSLQPGTCTALLGILSFGVGCSSAPIDVADAVVAESNPQGLSARPQARLILTGATLSRLKARASAGDSTWAALKQQCDGYATGTMYAPNGSAYTDFPNVRAGYQGEDYVPAIRALGLCY